MATEKKVQVVEKNPGTKIAWRQSGTKIIFGDDDLAIRCDTRQRDWPVQVDVCADDDSNLVIGVGEGRYYVAQISIPPIQYVEVPAGVLEISQPGEPGGVTREAQPLSMSDVILTLWSLDDLKAN